MLRTTGSALLAALAAAGAAALLVAPLPVRRPPGQSGASPVGRPRRPTGSGSPAPAARTSGEGLLHSTPSRRRAGPLRPAAGPRLLPQLGRPARAAVATASVCGCLLAAAAGLLAGPGVLALVGVAVAVAAHQRRCRSRERAVATGRRTAVIELCTALTAELRAGRSPAAALPVAAATTAPLADLLAAPLAAASSGVDVPAALRAAVVPGAQGLRRVAACWAVAADTGAGLAAALDRVADGLRAEEEVRREVQAQLAAPRASALLLAVLPGFALLLGAGVGADPVRMLLHTRVGTVCLVTGLTLSGLGVLWTDALAGAAEDRT